MPTLPSTEPKRNWAILAVRTLTWLSVGLFLGVAVIAPTGVTVPWTLYFILFGPVVAFDVSALIVFAFCRLHHQAVSFAYPLISLGVLTGVWFITWSVLRLR